MDESGTDFTMCCKNVASGRKIAIRSLVNARGLRLEWERELHVALLLFVLLYGSETIIWKEKDKSRIRVVLGIRRMDRVPNAWIRELCGVVKRVDEKIDKCVLHWFGHIKRMNKDRIAKRVYRGECG